MNNQSLIKCCLQKKFSIKELSRLQFNGKNRKVRVICFNANPGLEIL